MSKKFKFLPMNDKVAANIPGPKPARLYMPEWLKSMPRDIEQLSGVDTVGTAKKCMPFVDTFLSGYIQELPCDLKISYGGQRAGTGEDVINYDWAGPFKPMSSREQSENRRLIFPKFPGFYHTELQWDTFWEPETPKGYSTFYHHPSNRFDLPFQTMSGIIDTDKWPVTGPVPFLLREGFEGVIPQGTPLYQITFIKRENWESEHSGFDPKVEKLQYQARSVFTGGYKKKFWERKSFN